MCRRSTGLASIAPRAPRPRPPATAATMSPADADRRRAPPSTMPGRIRRRARGRQRRSAPSQAPSARQATETTEESALCAWNSPAQRAAGIPETGDGMQPVPEAASVTSSQDGSLSSASDSAGLPPRVRVTLQQVQAAMTDEIAGEAEHYAASDAASGVPGRLLARAWRGRRQRDSVQSAPSRGVSTWPPRSSAAPRAERLGHRLLDQRSPRPWPDEAVVEEQGEPPASASSVAVASSTARLSPNRARRQRRPSMFQWSNSCGSCNRVLSRT